MTTRQRACTPRSPVPVRGRSWFRHVVALIGSGAVLTSAWGASSAALKELSLEELMDVEVMSVSRSPVALADAPSALQVIDGQQIRRSGASRLPEALRLTDNLNVAQKNGHDWGISARGFNTELANKLLVMMDGRTIYTPLFSGVRWDVQDYLLEDIEQIEVISGPGASVWGANAVNGVINILTKSARDTQGFYAEAGGGNPLSGFTGARWGAQLAPNVFFRVYGKYFERAGELDDTRRGGDRSKMAQGGFRLDSGTESDGLLTVQGDIYHGFEGVPDSTEGKVAGGNLLARWSRELASGSTVQLQVYYDRTFLRRNFEASQFGPRGKFSETLDTYDFDFQHTIPHGTSNVATWGVGYRLTKDRTQQAPTFGFNPANIDQELFSGFAQEQVALGDRVRLTVGSKIEHNDYTGTEVEPSIRAQTKIGTDGMVWAAVSRAIRTPSRLDRDLRQPAVGQTILVGSGDFESETVVAYEAGYRAQLSSRLTGSLSVFYNDYSDIRSVRPTPATILPLVIANDLEGETHGLELAVNYDVLRWWRLRGGYTVLNTQLHVRAGGFDLNKSLNETADPEHQLSIGSAMDLPHRVELDLHLRWIDSLTVNNVGVPGSVPSYTELNARIGWHVSENIEFSVVGQNLLDHHHLEYGLPGPAQIEIRRSLFAKLSWRY